MKCPECGSTNIEDEGRVGDDSAQVLTDTKKMRCKDCGWPFYIDIEEVEG